MRWTGQCRIEFDYVDEEKVRALAKHKEAECTVRRYRAPDTLVSILQML